mmetsp:Transcript_128/g.427  ORF Transcript_128/g.427 Transcript_128/m.427 type:complete len:108 (-) Transcript_128:55-378(-)
MIRPMATTPPSTTSANGTNLNAAPNTPPAAPQKTNPTVSRVFLSPSNETDSARRRLRFETKSTLMNPPGGSPSGTGGRDSGVGKRQAGDALTSPVAKMRVGTPPASE